MALQYIVYYVAILPALENISCIGNDMIRAQFPGCYHIHVTYTQTLIRIVHTGIPTVEWQWFRSAESYRFPINTHICSPEYTPQVTFEHLLLDTAWVPGDKQMWNFAFGKVLESLIYRQTFIGEVACYQHMFTAYNDDRNYIHRLSHIIICVS